VVGRPSMSFAVLLRQLRAEAGLTQEELAARATLSPRSVSDLERGVAATTRRETARLLADALNLTGPARVMFEAAARGRVPAAEPPAPPASPAEVPASAMHGLPRDTASFTGRGPELEQLVSELESALSEQGSGRVVGVHAIDGMAGIGKTTFAVHAAHLLAPRFPDGQFFLPLHSHTPGQRPADPGAALGTLLLTTGIATKEIPDGLDARTMMWRNGVAGKKILLVLDDAASHDQVRPLLPGTAGSLVLITSRRRLAALEEATPISLDMLFPNEAADLFSRLVSRPAREPEAVAEITRLCGYLPLAIRLIAGALRRHPAWTVADLAAELAAAKDRLAAMRAENLSVAAAFDLSYTDLTPGQQRLFRRLGLHPGTTIDTHAAASLDGTAVEAARRHLDDLYDHHLISEPARGRYRMHDLLSEHARSLAAADPAEDRDHAIGRLLDYYLHGATEANRLIARIPSGTPVISSPPETPHWPSAEQAASWLGAELANLQACSEYAAAHGRPAHAVWIPAQLGDFFRTRGYQDQALTMCHRALTVAEAAGDRAGQAVNLANLGHAQYLAGDYQAATAFLARAVDVYREPEDRLGLVDALIALGRIETFMDRYAAAMEGLTEALSLCRELGDVPGQAHALDYLGFLQFARCDFPASRACLQEALTLYRTLGDQQGQASVLLHTGRLQRYTGDYDAAIASLVQSLALYGELGDRPGHASALYNLGAVQRLTGDHVAAGRSLNEALDLSMDLGIPQACAGVFMELGPLQHATGDHAAAAGSLARALELSREVGDRQGRAETLNHMGALLADSSGPADALSRYTEALTLAREIARPLDEADALAGIGHCLLRTGDTEQGLDHLRQALQIYQQIGTPGAERVQATLRQHAEASRP
jgi:tetratricopeptide (TPR) repeat protein/transcriptional regulator with XRE-family HTH domain